MMMNGKQQHLGVGEAVAVLLEEKGFIIGGSAPSKTRENALVTAIVTNHWKMRGLRLS